MGGVLKKSEIQEQAMVGRGDWWREVRGTKRLLNRRKEGEMKRLKEGEQSFDCSVL